MGRPRILCVDDRQESLVPRKMVLELFGCAVALAHDAKQCMAELSAGEVDLVLIDYHLGTGVTGEGVARDIRVLHPRIPLVMLTGDPKIPDSARASVDAVFIKGADGPPGLISTIQRLLPEAGLQKPRPPIHPQASSSNDK